MKKQKVFLKITSALALIAMMVAATDSPAGPITILWEDTFEGTDPITVEGGTGTGYTQFEFLEGSATGAAQLAAVVEANGVLTTLEQDGVRVEVPLPPVSVVGIEDLSDVGEDAFDDALVAKHARRGVGLALPPDLAEHNREVLAEIGLPDLAAQF